MDTSNCHSSVILRMLYTWQLHLPAIALRQKQSWAWASIIALSVLSVSGCRSGVGSWRMADMTVSFRWVKMPLLSCKTTQDTDSLWSCKTTQDTDSLWSCKTTQDTDSLWSCKTTQDTDSLWSCKTTQDTDSLWSCKTTQDTDSLWSCKTTQDTDSLWSCKTTQDTDSLWSCKTTQDTDSLWSYNNWETHLSGRARVFFHLAQTHAMYCKIVFK